MVKKLLITGISGFIGGHLAPLLIQQGYELHAILRPGTNYRPPHNWPLKVWLDKGSTTALLNYFQEVKFQGVVHLASCFLGQHQTADIPNLIESNILFGTRLIEAAAQTAVPWFLNTGTYWQHYGQKKYSPVNLYAATKQAFMDIAEYYRAVSGIKFVTLKLSDTYGPGDQRRKLLPIWREKLAKDEPMDMSGGYQKIDISHVTDVAAAFARLITLLGAADQSIASGAVFAVKANNTLTLRQLAQEVTRATGQRLRLNWGAQPYRPREIKTPWRYGRPVPGWQPKISLRQGLQEYFAE